LATASNAISVLSRLSNSRNGTMLGPMIGKRIADEIKPKFLRIGGYWYPRGGIPIDVF
jgi:hypothetical protein